MESLVAMTVAASILLRVTGPRRVSDLLFFVSLGLLVLILRLHTTDLLPLNF